MERPSKKMKCPFNKTWMGFFFAPSRSRRANEEIQARIRKDRHCLQHKGVTSVVPLPLRSTIDSSFAISSVMAYSLTGRPPRGLFPESEKTHSHALQRNRTDGRCTCDTPFPSLGRPVNHRQHVRSNRQCPRAACVSRGRQGLLYMDQSAHRSIRVCRAPGLRFF